MKEGVCFKSRRPLSIRIKLMSYEKQLHGSFSILV